MATELNLQRVKRVAEANFRDPASLQTWPDTYARVPSWSRWHATFGDYDLGSRVGSGPTPEAAIEDLLNQMEE